MLELAMHDLLLVIFSNMIGQLLTPWSRADNPIQIAVDLRTYIVICLYSGVLNTIMQANYCCNFKLLFVAIVFVSIIYVCPLWLLWSLKCNSNVISSYRVVLFQDKTLSTSCHITIWHPMTPALKKCVKSFARKGCDLSMNPCGCSMM